MLKATRGASVSLRCSPAAFAQRPWLLLAPISRLSCSIHRRHYSNASNNNSSSMTTSRKTPSEAEQQALTLAALRAYRAKRTADQSYHNTNVALYSASCILVLLGLSYAFVPLYRLFCQATGYGGTPKIIREEDDESEEDLMRMRPVRDATPIRIVFNADTSDALPWKFYPQQRDLYVVPGQTALAFYTAHNPTDKDIVGISTYNVMPAQMGPYFNKVQCFCFEEQKLKAGEKIDMPVFFFVDPDILDDPYAKRIHHAILSYTFFNARTAENPLIYPDPPTTPGIKHLQPSS